MPKPSHFRVDYHDKGGASCCTCTRFNLLSTRCKLHDFLIGTGDAMIWGSCRDLKVTPSTVVIVKKEPENAAE